MKRSYLFVPGNRPERFGKACASGADVVIIDLEDAVAPENKAAARAAIQSWLSAERNVYVRVNGADTAWYADDLALLASPGVAGVLLPKAEHAETIDDLAAASRSDIAIVPLIETALGVWNAEHIARARNVERIAFGSIDFQLDTGVLGDGVELLMVRSQLVLASRVAGVGPPIDGVTLALDDPARLSGDLDRARRLGFGAKLCIHPRQVAAVNAAFAPQASDIEWARRIVEAAESAGGDAIQLDGKMVDRPVIDRARALLSSIEQPSGAA